MQTVCKWRVERFTFYIYARLQKKVLYFLGVASRRFVDTITPTRTGTDRPCYSQSCAGLQLDEGSVPLRSNGMRWPPRVEQVKRGVWRFLHQQNQPGMKRSRVLTRCTDQLPCIIDCPIFRVVFDLCFFGSVCYRHGLRFNVRGGGQEKRVGGALLYASWFFLKK